MTVAARGRRRIAGDIASRERYQADDERGASDAPVAADKRLGRQGAEPMASASRGPGGR
jgi:hypothetical protein